MNQSLSARGGGTARPDSAVRPGGGGVGAHSFRGRRLATAGLLLITVIAAACGPRNPLPTRPAWESLPAGSPLRSRTLPEQDAWLRHYVMFGEHPEAIGAFEPESPLAPSDRLLRALQEAVVLHEAGEFARSNEVLEWAEVEADLRYTRSLSREVASILVSDRVLAYTPTAGELAMVPYYRMLNYLALGDGAGALVEARKANALLARLARDPLQRCHGDGLVQYLAGLVQGSAGELNDALVSLRQAERALSGCPGSPVTGGATVAADLYRTARAAGVTEIADSMAERYSLQVDPDAPAGTGDLVVVVEHGFVAHRAPEALHIPIPSKDLNDLDGDDESAVTRVAARLSSELLLNQDGPDGGNYRRRAYRSGWSDALDGAYILRLAWPTYRLEANRPREVRVGVGDAVAQPVELGNLSLVMREELASERPEMLARLVLRGLTKYLITREVEEKTEKKHGEAAGFLLGRIANIAGNQLEQADTRSWSLLPDRISLLRLRLPEGTHAVRIEVVGEGGGSWVRELGEVTVQAGGLAVVRERVWARDAEARWEEEFDAGELRFDAQPEPDSLETENPAVAADSITTAGS